MGKNEYSDTRLIEFWNDGSGAISWLDEVENELTYRGYEVRSTEPQDGRRRVGGERLYLEVNHPEIIKRRVLSASDVVTERSTKEGTERFWIAASTEAGAIDRARMFSDDRMIRSRWAGPGHYRSDVYIVDIQPA